MTACFSVWINSKLSQIFNPNKLISDNSVLTLCKMLVTIPNYSSRNVLK